MPNKKTKKGFTLIEALIVIAIIGILSAIGLNVFTRAQESGRDDRRKKDLAAIANALEGAKTDSAGSFSYPACETYSHVDVSSTNTSDLHYDNSEDNNRLFKYHYCLIDNTNTNPDLNPTTGQSYIKSVPKDPKTNQAYVYIPYYIGQGTASGAATCNNTTIRCSKFFLIACLESAHDPQQYTGPEGFYTNAPKDPAVCDLSSPKLFGYVKNNL